MKSSICVRILVAVVACTMHAFSFVSHGGMHGVLQNKAFVGSEASLGWKGVSSRFPLNSSTDEEGTTPTMPFLVGHGFDIHRLAPGLPLVIGGVTIPYELGAEAHSDGDVIYHSVVDAILGALTLPDIGQLFPDNDPRWKGADSSVFMEEAYRRMDEAGYTIGNVDVTLILQKPKVKDIKPAMKENIVRLLRTTPSQVNVKARTHEKVDSVGEGRSMACHVVVLLMKK
uniref:2-C-methyl-D-erythritol 2,4-cyclodiphosphate synthase n=1 Tax=Fibrocapsa japonica TaxID=94617 RepID=A0A7S2XZX5_9STRA